MTAASATAATAAPKQHKPRRKPVRRAAMILRPEPQGPGAVEIALDRLERAYLLTPFASDFGRAFQLEKIGTTTVYNVLLDGHDSSCDCPGFTYTGHCKHLDTIRELVAAGRL